MNTPLAYSLMIVSLAIGIGVGYSLSPEYRQDMIDKQTGSMELGSADKFLDKRFINGMIAHHLTAIDVAKQMLEKGHRAELRTLAEEIIRADTANIKELYTWKQNWYQDTRPVTTYTKVNLGEYDPNFDLRFLNALYTHHQEAIEVAAEVQTKSTRGEVLTLASNVGINLSKGLETISQWRKVWYGLE